MRDTNSQSLCVFLFKGNELLSIIVQEVEVAFVFDGRWKRYFVNFAADPGML